MKNFIIFILLGIICREGYSQPKNVFEKDKIEAINSYLDTTLKEKSEKIIITKEKINTNETIRMFLCDEYNPFLCKYKVWENRENVLLYNEEDFIKMKKEYQDTISDNKEKWLTNSYWKPENFKNKHITFEPFEDVFVKLERSLFPKEQQTMIYSFSEPIYYKNKKYLLFSVTVGSTNFAHFQNSVVVMKKLKEQWVLEVEIGDYIIN
ncbi:hypothetical protein [Flavobacterium limnophilum]|uniref:hypothetical protein n=1 Tax=Flavobacterium limnophilum TaxID=3003262 RepID=UPI0022ABC813|nr:hypothetical protein [Flavobacterium limnophilum]